MFQGEVPRGAAGRQDSTGKTERGGGNHKIQKMVNGIFALGV